MARYIKTIKELTPEQRCNWVEKHKPHLLGTRRGIGLVEWLDSLGVPKYRTTSYPLKEDYKKPDCPVYSYTHYLNCWENRKASWRSKTASRRCRKFR